MTFFVVVDRDAEIRKHVENILITRYIIWHKKRDLLAGHSGLSSPSGSRSQLPVLLHVKVLVEHFTVIEKVTG